MVRSKREKRKHPAERPDSPEDALLNETNPSMTDVPSNIVTKKFATSAKVLHMNELQVVFHLPMAEAAIKLGVCSTVLKKICRRNGISRWPYRLIRKIDKAIEELEQSYTAKLGTDDRAANDLKYKINTLKHLRSQIIENPEVDRSTELGAALNDKVSGDDGSEYGMGNIGLTVSRRSLGENPLSASSASSLPSSSNGLTMHNGLPTSSSSSLSSSSLSNPIISTTISSSLPSASSHHSSSLPYSSTSTNGSSQNNNFLNQTKNSMDNDNMAGKNVMSNSLGGSVGNRELMDVFPLESYNPANLKTVFPRDIIAEDAEEGYGFGGSLGLVDVSWNDNADPSTGMMLYRGENYEWLASHAAVVRACDGGLNHGGNVVDVMDGGPINDGIRTRQQNRISVDRGLCPILPPIDVSDITKLTKPDLLFAQDSDVSGPFDTEECRAGITIW